MEAKKIEGWHGHISAGRNDARRQVSYFAQTQAELYAMLQAGLAEMLQSCKRVKPANWYASVRQGHQDVCPDGHVFNVYMLHLGTAPDKERIVGGREQVEAFIAAGPFNNAEVKA